MRLAITIGRRHGSDTFETVSGPEVPPAQQVESFRLVCRDAFHPDFAELRFIDVDASLAKRVRLPSAKAASPAPEPTESHKPEPKSKKKKAHETSA